MNSKTKVFERHQVKEILLSLGYRLRNDGSNGWRASALYRNGNNPNSLKINNNGVFKDFVTGDSGPLEKLIGLTVGYDKVDNYIKGYKNGSYNKVESEQESIKFVANIQNSYLDGLIPRHTYWTKRGISEATIKPFRGGEMRMEGRFKNRYVFPIFNNKNEIIGLSGRYLYKNDKVSKWKHYNHKKEWVYPLFLNLNLIKKEKSVIIVESIGDCLTLMECGINNVIVAFGIEVSFKILNSLLVINPDKIYISFNNDAKGWGQEGAEKSYTRLSKFFRGGVVQKAILPYEGEDFNELLINGKKNLILNWYKNL